jgi:tRNA 2-selenouridine synthase
VRVIVLTGLPGVGKTAMLDRLAAAGEQVVDLEALAGHRGSSYGRVGLASVPPTKPEFDTLIASTLAACDPARPVWLEDEGPHIGRLWLPGEVVNAIATAETVELSCPLDERVERLCATYGTADPEELIAATQSIRRRLGNSRTDRAISHFHAGRPEAAIRVLLEYFDEGYALRAAGDTRRPLPADEIPAVLRDRR